MLSERPTTPVLGFAAASVSSDPDGTASGDWNDVIPLPRGGVALAVGDAVGRGRKAEPLKHLLQVAVRVLATDEQPLAGMLTRLRETVAPLDDGFATLIYTEIEPATGDLAIANAGHPPPLVIGANGAVRLLTGGTETPLGAPIAASVPPTRTRIRLNDTLVLYTDGLIESAHLDIGTGLNRLGHVAARWASAPLDALCARLVRLGFHDGQPVDDLTAVAVRLVASF